MTLELCMSHHDLEHELGDDPVENCAPVGEALLVLAAGDAVEVPAEDQVEIVFN